MGVSAGLTGVNGRVRKVARGTAGEALVGSRLREEAREAEGTVRSRGRRARLAVGSTG